MKSIAENLYRRGKQGVIYVRLRIPADVRRAYVSKQTFIKGPKQKYVTISLHTTDQRIGVQRSHEVMAKIQNEFDRIRSSTTFKRASYFPKPVSKLDEALLDNITQFYLRHVLAYDQSQREKGLMDDEEFLALGEKLSSQHAQLKGLFAQGKSMSVFHALHGFMRVCGIDFTPDEEEAKRASYSFLRAVIKALDVQLKRQDGDYIPTDSVVPEVAHPLAQLDSASLTRSGVELSWTEIFDQWIIYNKGLPKSTEIAAKTPWGDLERFAKSKGVTSPEKVTEVLMSEWVNAMDKKGLAVKTINERIGKVRRIYDVAVGKHLLKLNPASTTMGFNERRINKVDRLPFTPQDIQSVFNSPIFTENLRSPGQTGEASYWLPLILFYSGMRPEEVAGLALIDIIEDPTHGWYFNLVNRPTLSGFNGVYPDSIPASHRRTLKNKPSIRKVPIAQELIALGLPSYIEFVRESGNCVLFPTLKKDGQGKLSGSASKFFGRYLRDVVGILDKQKVLYSFRHSFKDLMEQAQIPTKYLKRIMGHSSGDGVVTDDYGSGIPFEVLASYFAKIQFPSINAKPWEPGAGYIRRSNAAIN